MTSAIIDYGLSAAAQKPPLFIIVLVPVLIFIAATAVSGWITYRIRTKKFRESQKDETDTEER